MLGNPLVKHMKSLNYVSAYFLDKIHGNIVRKGQLKIEIHIIYVLRCKSSNIITGHAYLSSTVYRILKFFFGFKIIAISRDRSIISYKYIFFYVFMLFSITLYNNLRTIVYK
ncbi:hypothetical protein EDEG_01696 [Edhazardia aedis USNM 41457]|uniref:Uncharacterized protein n=1 Tax=Edhazardia aedis (strain USNM 41457) TaxID=1003232 RepID=J8ZWE2_EDHAE|nr:hypothetical protein EDEG_01696 [Edhazardia aedis USNM 41457]|eukprot:EJW04013.1 hypothetical protein EDEG_01696 [Edhazardia aedis USNM 41457]